MTTIATLQQKLEARAHAEAKREIEAVIKALPYFERATIIGGSGSIEAQNFHVLEGIKRAMIERRYSTRLDELTAQLLGAVDKIAEIENWREEG